LPINYNFKFKRETRKANPQKLYKVSDGDTPVIEQPIRMVSCDTPEKAGYAGKPETSQAKLDKCRQRLQGNFYDGKIPKGLRDYLIEKLTPDAAQRHIDAGNDASKEFEAILEERLTMPNGKKRQVGIIPTGEIIDVYGRMLAYITPYFAGGSDPLPPKGDPRRRTFNLQMVEGGWAACFVIYPSLPKNDDMKLLIEAAEDAWDSQRGMWAKYGQDLLLAYEYRMCVKLGTAETAAQGVKGAFQRHCVNLENRKLEGKFGFYKVSPPRRLWIWEKDLAQAKIDLELK
jgi:endonuclease YncB( thermonuclease family)